MLMPIAKRKRDDRPERLIERFEACHARIRAFLALAEKLGDEAAVREATPEQRVEAALDVARYFSRAFPRHARDEDEVVGPRLGPEAAPIMARLAREHERDRPDVEELVIACDAIANAEPWPSLAKLVASLAPRIEAHLAYEEREMFPLVRALSEEVEQEAMNEMQARRQDGRGERDRAT